ncbi:MAG: FAD binding domain-containing protein [Candidatus Neomarinimicrobiota bacterium]
MKYYRPETTAQLFTLLTDIPANRRTLLAGGTDLLPRYENGSALPDNLIDLKKIPDFCGITEFSDRIEIGALTTIEILKNNALVRDHFHGLWLATTQFAGVQIRHRATLGGNIVNASPAGDTLPALYAHRAKLRLIGPTAEREVAIADFISGPGKTITREDEILQAVILPKSAGFSTFYKLGLRQTMAISVVNFALVGKIMSGGFTNLTIAAGAVAPTVKYLFRFSTTVVQEGRSLGDSIDLVDADIAPIDDIRASADYRRRALKNVLVFTLQELVNKG